MPLLVQPFGGLFRQFPDILPAQVRLVFSLKDFKDTVSQLRIRLSGTVACLGQACWIQPILFSIDATGSGSIRLETAIPGWPPGSSIIPHLGCTFCDESPIVDTKKGTFWSITSFLAPAFETSYQAFCVKFFNGRSAKTGLCPGGSSCAP